MLELRALGALEVLDEGKPLDLPGGVPEKVLAVLIAREGKPLNADELVSRLWPDNPPKTARDSVYNAICQLKKITVGPYRDPLVRKNKKGYYVETESALLDLTRFAEALARADEAADRGDLEVAWKELETALSLWHGDEPMAGLDCPALTDLASDLKQRRADAREQWCDIGQRLGRHQKVLPALRSLARENPLAESVRGKLMLALEQTGRPAEALAAYDSIRRHLAADLGTAPGPGLQALHQRILGPSRKRGMDAPEDDQPI